MENTANVTLADLEAQRAHLEAQKRDIVACINAVPLRQLTRRNAEYVLLLDKLRQLREQVLRLVLAQQALATRQN